MNEIDFSQLEKLQKQMERTDYTQSLCIGYECNFTEGIKIHQ